MNLPISPTFIGSDPMFMGRMAALSAALEDIFRRMDSLKLSRAHRGLTGLKFHQNTIGGEPVYYHPREDCLYIYPGAFQFGVRPDALIYRGFGQRFSHKHLAAQQKLQWAKKYVYVDRAVVDQLASYLDGNTTYKEALSRFHSAVERLQVIHVLNALTANSVNSVAVGSLDLDDYPPTMDFVHGRRPYSLQPILSAYAGKRLNHYEDAFAEYCMYNGELKVDEQNVQDTLTELFKNITFQ